MNTNRSCGCKSFRSCILCENEHGLQPRQEGQGQRDGGEVWLYDIETGRCINKGDLDDAREFPGIMIIPNFITEGEQEELVKKLDELPWDSSQSGRRKQNFGPRANFKKRKAKLGSFSGFPVCTKFIQERFKTVPLLEGYRTVEQCSIEYRPETGASIEPHIDDCWIWGERIVQLNLVSDAVLTMNPYIEGEKYKYNLKDVLTYPKIVEDNKVVYNPFEEDKMSSTSCFSMSSPSLYPVSSLVQVPLPARSLLIMWGSARYEWEHAVLRKDITARRIVVAYRELTPPYLPGGQEQELGQEILQKAEIFSQDGRTVIAA